MPKQSISQLLRRAVLVQLSITCALVACGVQTGCDGGQKASTAPCRVISPPSGLGENGTCLTGISYQFEGTYSECAGIDAANPDNTIPLATCQAFCPPVSDAGTLSDIAKLPLSYCLIVMGEQGKSELHCEYAENCGAGTTGLVDGGADGD